MQYDFIIVGSGFGGSVSALRLSEKGYRVLVIEKGRRFNPGDFANDNRDLKKWMWRPSLGLKGIFHMAFLRHVTVLHGVGVGGGSLTYASTLPTPKDSFFNAPSWSRLANWKKELAPHYETGLRMLGAAENPRETPGDRVLREIAQEDGREHHFHRTRVALFFGDEGKRVPDPFFGGEGPERTGCTFCGACMTGCNVGAKNTLDHNYLYLAEKLGAEILSEREVAAIRPRDGGGYSVEVHPTFGRKSVETFEAGKVILSAGVMGTIPLLLRMKEREDCLPRLSDTLGKSVRTNSEALIGIIAPDFEEDLHEGVAITSILHTDDHSHIEPVRYGRGSDFFRFLSGPHAPGKWAISRILRSIGHLIAHPRKWAKVYFMSRAKFSTKTQVLLFMRSIEGAINLELGRSIFTGFRRGLVSRVDNPEEAPEAFMEDATNLANRFAEKVDGVVSSLNIETILGSPSTAHILGGACMGSSADDGVIDDKHRVFGYDGLYVIDGAAISANPGVNPSLTITALAERAMSCIEAKHEARQDDSANVQAIREKCA